MMILIIAMIMTIICRQDISTTLSWLVSNHQPALLPLHPYDDDDEDDDDDVGDDDVDLTLALARTSLLQ